MQYATIDDKRTIMASLRIHVPIPSHLPAEGIGIYKNIYKAGIMADRYIQDIPPEQRQDLFEHISDFTVRGASAFSAMPHFKRPEFIDVAITQPGFGTVMSALLSGTSFYYSNAPSNFYFDFLSDIKPDYCAKVLVRLPYYYGLHPIVALDNHLGLGLHGSFIGETLYSRSLDPIPVVQPKDAVWYYSCLGTVISDMAIRRTESKVFEIMDNLIALPNGPELVALLSDHIHLP